MPQQSIQVQYDAISAQLGSWKMLACSSVFTGALSMIFGIPYLVLSCFKPTYPFVTGTPIIAGILILVMGMYGVKAVNEVQATSQLAPTINMRVHQGLMYSTYGLTGYNNACLIHAVVVCSLGIANSSCAYSRGVISWLAGVEMLLGILMTVQAGAVGTVMRKCAKACQKNANSGVNNELGPKW